MQWTEYPFYKQFLSQVGEVFVCLFFDVVLLIHSYNRLQIQNYLSFLAVPYSGPSFHQGLL